MEKIVKESRERKRDIENQGKAENWKEMEGKIMKWKCDAENEKIEIKEKNCKKKRIRKKREKVGWMKRVKNRKKWKKIMKKKMESQRK